MVTNDNQKFRAFIRWLHLRMKKQVDKAQQDMTLYGTGTIRISGSLFSDGEHEVKKISDTDSFEFKT